MSLAYTLTQIFASVAKIGGVPPGEKKVQKSAKKRVFRWKNGDFWSIFDKFRAKFHVFKKNVLRIAPRVFRYKGASSVWRKPANLYSTKCRIFGISGPCGGTVVDTTTPSPTVREKNFFSQLPDAHKFFFFKKKFVNKKNKKFFFIL